MEVGQHLVPVEIKSGKTLVRDSYAGLEKWRTLAGERCGEPILVYGGSDRYRHQGIRVLGWRDCGQVLNSG